MSLQQVLMSVDYSNRLHSSDQMSLHWARLSLMTTQRACALLTKCHFIRLDCLLWPLKEFALFWPNGTSTGHNVCWPLKQLALFWPNVTSSDQIVFYGHCKSLHSSAKCHSFRPDWYGHSNCSYSSDQMLLHQAILPVMAAQTARTLLTKCHSIRPDCYGHSESLHSAN